MKLYSVSFFFLRQYFTTELILETLFTLELGFYSY